MSMDADSEDFHDRRTAEAFLSRLGTLGDARLPLARAALALAALERPRVEVAPYHEHLDALAVAVGEAAATAVDAADRVAALNAVILGRHGYQGDAETYDDLQNADLMRVIDRRKGLPVALGILYIHAARAQGWDMVGLAFPGHFLVRLDHRGERAVLDPFHGGQVRGASDLRELLKAIAGNEAELAPAHYAPVSDRDILVRLQNNVKLRLIEGQQLEKALAVIDGMTLFAPEQPGLWREAGLVNAQLGNLKAAVTAFERFLGLAADGVQRHQVASLLQRLRTQLQ
jgi:regulator of sirC expression with transglutaminase-like and TPR domain